jgi:hypothetical protein
VHLIAAGYLYKKVAPRADWFGRPGRPQRICSMCPHISPDFADYIDFWRHNGYWLFDRPEIIEDIATEHGIGLDGLTCFYYEEYEQQYDSDTGRWLPVAADKNMPTAVVQPLEHATLLGYDVVTFSTGNAPECSPLSCNGIAEQVAVNDDCLFATFEEAKRALEGGLFRNAEPGPCRIVAVFRVERGAAAAH